ncbi:hypothetical protein C8R46DRAFT_1071958 [Mycena filopes]|nr:hypothetical protein C8R46DRAFT_1071958 [Mycena filopes]
MSTGDFLPRGSSEDRYAENRSGVAVAAVLRASPVWRVREKKILQNEDDNRINEAILVQSPLVRSYCRACGTIERVDGRLVRVAPREIAHRARRCVKMRGVGIRMWGQRGAVVRGGHAISVIVSGGFLRRRASTRVILVVALVRICLGIRGSVVGSRVVLLLLLVSGVLIVLLLLLLVNGVLVVLLLFRVGGGVILFWCNVGVGVGRSRGVVVIACVDQVLVGRAVVRYRRGVGVHGLVSEGHHARSGRVLRIGSIDGAFCIVKGIPGAVAACGASSENNNKAGKDADH